MKPVCTTALSTFTRRGLCLLAVLCGMLQAASGATYYSKVTSGNINAVASWTADTVTNPNAPSITAGDILVIRNGHTITLNPTGAYSVAQVIIRSGGVFTANGTRTINTSSPFTIEPGGRLNLATRNITIGGDCINNGLIDGTTGQLTMNTGTFTNNGEFNVTTGRINLTTGSIINNTTITLTGGRIIVGDGTLLNAGSITIGSGGYLTQSAGSITNTSTGTIEVSGISSTATITLGSGDLINQNTSQSIDFASSAIGLTGTADHVVGGFVTRGRINFNKTGGTTTFTGNIWMNGISVNGSGGTLNLGAGLEHTSTGAIGLTAGTLLGGTSTMLVGFIGSAWTGTGSVFVPESSTIVFNGAGNQQITSSAPREFYNLRFMNTGLKSKNSNAMTVTHIFSVEDDVTISGTANQVPPLGTDATLQYVNANNRVPGLEWPATFTAAGGVLVQSGTIVPGSAKVFAENVPLTIASGATLSVGANQFTFNGDFINNGNWTPSSGNIVLAGTVNQSIGSFETTGAVVFSKTDGVALLQGNMLTADLDMNGAGGILRLGSGNHIVTGTWTNTAGTMRCNTSTLFIDGQVSGTAINFNPNNGTVHFRGAAAQVIPGFTYNKLELSGAGQKTLDTDTEVQDELFIQADAELSIGSNTLILSGTGEPLVSDGVFTAETGTVRYSAAAITTIAALNYYHLDASGGNRILAPAGVTGIAGTFTPGSGSYVVANSTVSFNGSSTQDLPAFTFYALVLTNGSNKRIAANTVVGCNSVRVENGASMEINGTGGGRLNISQ